MSIKRGEISIARCHGKPNEDLPNDTSLYLPTIVCRLGIKKNELLIAVIGK
jgi:hypothetical protein